MMLHAELGNYSSKKSIDFDLNNQEEVDLFCPLCNQSIDYEQKKGYAKLLRIADAESTIIFSKFYGQKRTFHIEGDNITTYGEHAMKYSDPEWFL